MKNISLSDKKKTQVGQKRVKKSWLTFAVLEKGDTPIYLELPNSVDKG